MSCERCGCGKEATTVKLTGGYLAKLCLLCRNEWHVVINSSEVYKEYCTAAVTLDFYMAKVLGGNTGFEPAKLDLVLKAIDDQNKAAEELFRIGHAFVTDKQSWEVTTAADKPLKKLPVGPVGDPVELPAEIPDDEEKANE